MAENSSEHRNPTERGYLLRRGLQLAPQLFTRDGARDLFFRVERRIARRYSDVEMRQLKSLERAYRREPGPELLIFGDSFMFWTAPTDDDHRHLVQMIRDEVSPDATFEALVGPGYQPRIIMAFLSALPKLPARPRVVIVPTSMLMASSSWLAHPYYAYDEVSRLIREAAAGGRRGRPRRLPRPTEQQVEDYDRLPAPSLIGARRTLGEARLFLNAKPTSRWQRIIRLRHLMDYYNAERLEPDSPGVQLIRDMSDMLKELDLPAVAYIPPVDHETVRKTLGEQSVEHVRRNAAIVEDAFDGTTVNAALSTPSDEFCDPAHLNDKGRLRLARSIAEAVKPILEKN